jgi:flagellar protein FliO/FliZ
MKRFVQARPRSRGARACGLYVWTHLGVCTAAWAAPAADTGRSAWLIGELLLIALLAVCGWVAVYLLKRRNRLVHGEAEPVKVVGGTALGGRERVVMLQARGRLFLLGVTPNNVSLLAELGPASASLTQAPEQEPA